MYLNRIMLFESDFFKFLGGDHAMSYLWLVICTHGHHVDFEWPSCSHGVANLRKLLKIRYLCMVSAMMLEF